MFNLTPWRKRERNDVTRFRNDLFNQFFEMNPFGGREFFSERGWFPTTDVSETKDKITVKAEIPGVEKDNIDLYIDGRTLTIKGEKKQEKEKKGENFHRVERSYGSFNRTMELPAEVDESKVDASYKNGILKIVMKKTKASEAKKIEVKSA